MATKQPHPVLPESVSKSSDTKFKGYSLEDLRYHRALVALQKEFAKNKVLGTTRKIQRHSPFSKDFGADKSTAGKFGALAGKLVTGLNYLDYAMIGVTLFNSTRKIFSIFHKKK